MHSFRAVCVNFSGCLLDGPTQWQLTHSDHLTGLIEMGAAGVLFSMALGKNSSETDRLPFKYILYLFVQGDKIDVRSRCTVYIEGLLLLIQESHKSFPPPVCADWMSYSGINTPAENTLGLLLHVCHWPGCGQSRPDQW